MCLTRTKPASSRDSATEDLPSGRRTKFILLSVLWRTALIIICVATVAATYVFG